MKQYIWYIFIVFLSGNRCKELSTYTAAVVEFNPPENISTNFLSVINAKNELVEIIQSLAENVDIVILPEGAFGFTTLVLPNSKVFCDDPNAHTLLHDISCAARNTKKYVVTNLYMKVDCSKDDQKNCTNLEDHTNKYNMAIVFDRQGVIIAKYRKFHLYGENAQVTEKPDFTTFRTDFNVTFGLSICFDLIFNDPQNVLVEHGVRNFIFPTMWFSELPYLSAVQYQQSWAYANNVNLLAANINWPVQNCTGSGIYAGRLGALESFVSQSPMTKVLIANVPTIPPDATSPLSKNQLALIQNSISIMKPTSDKDVDTKLKLENLNSFSFKFLDFASNPIQKGRVCNGRTCCLYDIEVSDNGPKDGQKTYSYAISTFDGDRHYGKIPNLSTSQTICSIIACTHQCGTRYSTNVHSRYTFKKIHLRVDILPSRGMKVMPNTLANNLLALNTTEFDLKLSQQPGGKKYAASLTLNVPKSDILTFGIFSRDYSKDITK